MANKKAKMTKALKKILDGICENTAEGEKTYVDGRAKPLVDLGYIHVDDNDLDETDDVAAMASVEGMELCGYSDESEQPNDESDGENMNEKGYEEIEQVCISITIDDEIPMPRKKSGGSGKRGSKYPFEDLEISQSLHLPLCEKYKNPARTLASSASRMNKLYDGERRFEVRPVDETDPKGAGARAWRIEVPVEDSAE